MKEQCKQAIYSYVDLETQLNAAATGEHINYVHMVLQLLRDEYKVQANAGLTTFTVPTIIHDTIISERPW